MAKYLSSFLLGLASLISLYSPSVVAQSCGLPFDYSGAPRFASGWGGYLLVNDLGRARSLEFDRSGNLLVAEASRGITLLTIGSNGNCVTVTSRKLLIADSNLNHGLALSVDGTKIYASSAQDVHVWDYNAAAQTVSNRRTIVTGMLQGGHPTRTLLIPRSSPNTLLVSRGSDGNLDQDCLVQSLGTCMIKQFNIGTLPSTPYNYNTQGTILGWGLRNSVGVAEAPDGGIWSVENSADNVMRNNVDVHQDNPAEELNYHGMLTGTNNLLGANYGYPTCFAAWRVGEIPSPGNLQTGDQFVFQPNSTFTDATCQQRYQKPRLSFQAHTAPLDIKFYRPDVTGGTCTANAAAGGLGCDFVGNAFVGFHGSWNRDIPVGYNVGMIPFTSNAPTAASNSMTGTQDILSNANTASCPNGCFRPVGMNFDSKGRLFLASDSTGDIIVVTRSGGTGTPTTSTTSTTGPTTTTTTRPPTTTTTSGGAVSQPWGQCGGIGWNGAKLCTSGHTCVYVNDYYSQCRPN